MVIVKTKLLPYHVLDKADGTSEPVSFQATGLVHSDIYGS
jgi:hypothetical protein